MSFKFNYSEAYRRIAQHETAKVANPAKTRAESQAHSFAGRANLANEQQCAVHGDVTGESGANPDSALVSHDSRDWLTTEEAPRADLSPFSRISHEDDRLNAVAGRDAWLIARNVLEMFAPDDIEPGALRLVISEVYALSGPEQIAWWQAAALWLNHRSPAWAVRQYDLMSAEWDRQGCRG